MGHLFLHRWVLVVLDVQEVFPTQGWSDPRYQSGRLWLPIRYGFNPYSVVAS